jgi:hypothetical protein
MSPIHFFSFQKKSYHQYKRIGHTHMPMPRGDVTWQASSGAGMFWPELHFRDAMWTERFWAQNGKNTHEEKDTNIYTACHEESSSQQLQLTAPVLALQALQWLQGTDIVAGVVFNFSLNRSMRMCVMHLMCYGVSDRKSFTSFSFVLVPNRFGFSLSLKLSVSSA